MKVHGGTLSGATLGQGGSAPQVQAQPHPLSALLFGKRMPPLVDPKRYPHLKKSLRKLKLIKSQVSEILGVEDETFSLALAEGGNASVSRDGTLAFGVELLEEHEHDNDLLVAIVGHEVGHQPWTWPEGDLSFLKKRELDALYREEEAKADRFAGRVLGELGVSPSSVCRFLLARGRFEGGRVTDYYPAEDRARLITAACERRQRQLQDAARWNPRAAQRARELR